MNNIRTDFKQLISKLPLHILKDMKARFINYNINNIVIKTVIYDIDSEISLRERGDI